MNKKLGKLPRKHDPRTLLFAAYLLQASLPTPPEGVNYTAGVSGMMANDVAGDCTCAAAGHLIQAWTTAATGNTLTVSDDDILAAYEKLSGYNPTTGLNDNGAAMLDVLKLWLNEGIGGHKIGAFAAIDPRNMQHMKTALWMGCGLYLGFNLPLTAQEQDAWDEPRGGWVGDGEPGTWGGHTVAGLAYQTERFRILGWQKDGLIVNTWGEPKLVTWAFIFACCDEAYVIFSLDMMAEGKSVAGFDQPTLLRDFELVRQD